MSEKIFITSGKGGVGKSTVTALLGVALASLGNKVLLIELDLGLRSLDIILGVQDKAIFDLNDVLESRCSINKATVICEYSPNLNLISASLNSFVTFDENDLRSLFDSISSGYDYILIDSPAGIGSSFRTALRLIDRSLIVVTPDPVAIRDACKVSQILCDYGVTDQRLVINKVKDKYTKLNILPDLDFVIDGVGVRLIAVVPDDVNIVKATSKGEGLPKDTVAYKVFNSLAKRVIGKYVPLNIK